MSVIIPNIILLGRKLISVVFARAQRGAWCGPGSLIPPREVRHEDVPLVRGPASPVPQLRQSPRRRVLAHAPQSAIYLSSMAAPPETHRQAQARALPGRPASIGRGGASSAIGRPWRMMVMTAPFSTSSSSTDAFLRNSLTLTLFMPTFAYAFTASRTPRLRRTFKTVSYRGRAITRRGAERDPPASYRAVLARAEPC